MTFVIVAYDISDDYKRDLAARTLLSMGFQRVQRSVYVARGGSGFARQVAAALRRVIDWETDRVDIIVVPDYAWLGRLTLGEGLNIPGVKKQQGVTVV